MRIAYVDSSCVVAIAFRERGSTEIARRLAAYDQRVSSNLLEAEVRSACWREGHGVDPELLDSFNWVQADRPLSNELIAVLEVGYLRGADAWHVATALFSTTDPSEVHFETLDLPQRRIAAALGFKT